MKQMTVVLVTLSLTATAPLASAESLKMSVGKAAVSGSLQFTLTSGEHTLQVQLPLESMTAGEKAQQIADAITAQDPSGTWRGVVTGASLAFEHLVDGQWIAADGVSQISDTTGAGTGLSKNGATTKFRLQLDGNAPAASGVDEQGSPSFITVSVTDTLAFTHPILPGESPEQIVGLLYTSLLDQVGPGLAVTLKADNTVEITVSNDSGASLSWQVTDTALKPHTKGGSDKDAGVIDR